MALIDDKIVAFSSLIASLPIRPNADGGLTADELQEYWDESSEELRIAINNVIDRLISAAGAGDLGATPVPGGTAETVQGILVELNTLIGNKADASSTYTEIEVDSLLILKADDDEVVKLTGSQTIEGNKSFTLSPQVPTPDSSGDAANKGYVDSVTAAVVLGQIPDGSLTDDKQSSDTKIGSLAGLSALLAGFTSSLTVAINKIVSWIGDLATLNTAAQTSLVGAINEVISETDALLQNAPALTAGTASALTATVAGFTLSDGETVRIKLHTGLGDGATLNINGLGAVSMVSTTGSVLPTGAISGSYLTLIYNGSSFVLQGESTPSLPTATKSAVAGENISAGDRVEMYNGKWWKSYGASKLDPISQIRESIGGLTNAIVCEAEPDEFVMVNATSPMTIRKFTYNPVTKLITVGAVVNISTFASSIYGGSFAMVYLGSNKFLVQACDTSGYPKTCVFDFDGVSVTNYGYLASAQDGLAPTGLAMVKISSTKVLTLRTYGGTVASRMYALMITISGTTITIGGFQQTNDSAAITRVSPLIALLSSTTGIFMFIGGTQIRAIPFSLSGDTVTWGTAIYPIGTSDQFAVSAISPTHATCVALCSGNVRSFLLKYVSNVLTVVASTYVSLTPTDTSCVFERLMSDNGVIMLNMVDVLKRNSIRIAKYGTDDNMKVSIVPTGWQSLIDNVEMVVSRSNNVKVTIKTTDDNYVSAMVRSDATLYYLAYHAVPYAEAIAQTTVTVDQTLVGNIIL